MTCRLQSHQPLPLINYGICVWSVGWPDDHSEESHGLEEAKIGYTEQFQLSATKASEKFGRHEDCLKVFLVQFHGDGSFFLDDADLIQIVEEAQLPSLIDQVWIALQDWVSEYDYQITWQRVR